MEDNKTIVIQAKPSSATHDDSYDLNAIKEFFYVCLAGWKWFALSFVVFTVCAFLYLQTTEPLYTRSASVHIKEDSRKGSIGNISEEFSDLGIGNTGMSVNNEVVAFNSLELAEQVVKQMNLCVRVKADDGMRKNVLYGETLPISVAFVDIKDEDAVSFTLELLGQEEFKMSDFRYNGENVDFEKVASYGTKIPSAAGSIILFQTTNFSNDQTPKRLYVSHIPLSIARDNLHGRLKAIQNNTKNSIIDITYEDENIERAEAVINTLITEYNKNWIKDKNELGVLTSRFIDERIKTLQFELGGVDSDIATYKSSNLITTTELAANLLLDQASESDRRIMVLNNQIQMCQYLIDYISNGVKDSLSTGAVGSRGLIPANVGIESAELTSLIAAYNQQMLQRNTYADNSSEKNPLVLNLDAELQAQRTVIMQSLYNVLKNLETQMQSTTKAMRQSTLKLSGAPVQEKNLLSMDRQQKVKESLYLFLLQKREENELSQAFSAYNTRIISRPMGSNLPTSPVPVRIYLIVIISGFIFPVVVLYLCEMLNGKVRGRKDIERLTVPFVGEIPLIKDKKTDFVVKQGNRDVVNEAFRIVRSNLKFMLCPGSGEHRLVVLVTSFVSGSGKSFLSINLASVFGLQKDTRVAVVDLDIRKTTLSKIVGNPEYGVSDYLGGFKDDWHSLLHQSEENSNVDVLPVGHVPPNPTELLQSERLSILLAEMRREYDIIFLDMPPVEIVADVTIVKHLADITLLVVRVGNLERSMLPVIDGYYKNKTFNNLAILLNGSDIRSHRYGYGHYGYGEVSY